MIKKVFKKILCIIIIITVYIGNFCPVCYVKDFVYTKEVICIKIAFQY